LVIKIPPNSTRAVGIPDLNLSESWRIKPGSSIFSAELHGIRKALSSMYSSESPTTGIHLFANSSSTIKDIASPNKPTNCCIAKIRNLLGCQVKRFLH
jgi:hypothetical protein